MTAAFMWSLDSKILLTQEEIYWTSFQNRTKWSSFDKKGDQIKEWESNLVIFFQFLFFSFFLISVYSFSLFSFFQNFQVLLLCYTSLSVFDHYFVGLALKGLKPSKLSNLEYLISDWGSPIYLRVKLMVVRK